MSRLQPLFLYVKTPPRALHASSLGQITALTLNSLTLAPVPPDYSSQFRTEIILAVASMSRVLVLIAVTAAMVCMASARPVENSAECGHQAYDAVCLFNMCCSKDGQCGNKDECGAGCQSGPCEKVDASITAECGKQAHDAECWPRSQCCSADGMCGTGDAFCGNGCQGGSCYRSPVNLE